MGKPDAVLIVGASMLQLPMLRTAYQMGSRVLVTDANPDAPGARIAQQFYPLSTQDLSGHRKLVHHIQEHYTLRGVATCGADVAPTVATAAHAAGLPGLPPCVAHLTHNKAMVRHALTAAGVTAQPQWRVLRGRTYGDPLDTVRQLGPLLGRPLVVKPVEQRGSRGVTLVDYPAQLADAVETAQRYRAGVLIEERLYGSEHSAEIIYGDDGTPCFFNIVDRQFDYANGIAMETGHINPSRVTAEQWQVMRDLVDQAAQALGVHWGPFKCDLMLTPEGPMILECTARLSGGFDCQETTPLATGRDPIRQVLALACGRPLGWSPASVPETPPVGRWAACAAAFPPPGRVAALPSPGAGLDREGIASVYVTVQPGDRIEPYRHCAQRPAFAIASADDYDRAWCRAKAAARSVAKQFTILDEDAWQRSKRW